MKKKNCELFAKNLNVTSLQLIIDIQTVGKMMVNFGLIFYFVFFLLCIFLGKFVGVKERQADTI